MSTLRSLFAIPILFATIIVSGCGESGPSDAEIQAREQAIRDSIQQAETDQKEAEELPSEPQFKYFLDPFPKDLGLKLKGKKGRYCILHGYSRKLYEDFLAEEFITELPTGLLVRVDSIIRRIHTSRDQIDSLYKITTVDGRYSGWTEWAEISFGKNLKPLQKLPVKWFSWLSDPFHRIIIHPDSNDISLWRGIQFKYWDGEDTVSLPTFRLLYSPGILAITDSATGDIEKIFLDRDTTGITWYNPGADHFWYDPNFGIEDSLLTWKVFESLFKDYNFSPMTSGIKKYQQAAHSWLSAEGYPAWNTSDGHLDTKRGVFIDQEFFEELRFKNFESEFIPDYAYCSLKPTYPGRFANIGHYGYKAHANFRISAFLTGYIVSHYEEHAQGTMDLNFEVWVAESKWGQREIKYRVPFLNRGEHGVHGSFDRTLMDAWMWDPNEDSYLDIIRKRFIAFWETDDKDYDFEISTSYTTGAEKYVVDHESECPDDFKPKYIFQVHERQELMDLAAKDIRGTH